MTQVSGLERPHCIYFLILTYFLLEGVNNDGSGMAALLEIGKQLVGALLKCTFPNTIILAAFDMEQSVSASF